MMDQKYLNNQMSHGKVSYNFVNNNQVMIGQVKTDNILFVADLPEETSEEDLENFFRNYNFMVAKLIRESAEKSRYELNGVKITAKYSTNKISKPVRLCRYETKNTQSENQRDPKYNLLIKNVSKEISQHNFWRLFRDFGDIRSCKLAIDYIGNNKGFGFVNFYRAEDAEKAKRELDGKEVQGKLLKVTNLEYGRRVEKKKNNIYVKHLPTDNYSDNDLKKFGIIKSAVVIKDNNNSSKGFGFVCFENPQEAEEAVNQMRNQQVYEGCPPLYLNFAMKKSERQEILLKKKEELYRLAQKMTIFAKIKDENSINDENDFKQKIKNTMKLIMNPTFEPKSIKVRFDTKNAFITMNNQREAEEFIRKINDPSKKLILNEIFFSLYKSKVERITSNSSFKRYNDIKTNSISGSGMGSHIHKSYNFSDSTQNYTTSNQQGRYKTFNQEYLNPKVSNFQQQNSYNQPKISYNNFENPNMMMQPQTNFNNINQQMIQMNQPIINKQQPSIQAQKPKLNVQNMTLDDIGDFIYAYCEKLYPNEAPKITGMIIELPEDNLRFLVSEDNLVHLDDLIKNAFIQCKESSE